MENIDSTEIKYINKRLDTLEQTQKEQITKMNDLLVLFKGTTVELKTISKNLETMTINFKEAIMRSSTNNEKEIKILKEKDVELEKRMDKLEAKIDRETVMADSENWQKAKWIIISVFLTAIATMLINGTISDLIK